MNNDAYWADKTKEEFKANIMSEISLMVRGTQIDSTEKVFNYILNDLPNNPEYIQYLIDQGKVGLDENKIIGIDLEVEYRLLQGDIPDYVTRQEYLAAALGLVTKSVIIPTVKGEGGERAA